MTTHKLSIPYIVIFSLLISACANTPTKIKTTAPHLSSNVTQTLYTQYAEWKSVKYKWGGISKSGIDCSGFVYRTFADKFNIKLPRTTKQQVNRGTTVNQQSELSAGDLVFFKTGLYQRHVGIYLKNRRFLHVSTSKGVTISHLDNSYWRKKYWTAIRVLYSP